MLPKKTKSLLAGLGIVCLGLWLVAQPSPSYAGPDDALFSYVLKAARSVVTPVDYDDVQIQIQEQIQDDYDDRKQISADLEDIQRLLDKEENVHMIQMQFQDE